jgi:tRNA (guanine-N7-)-methyltransferase
MGRRALRKIDASLDLSRHLRTLDQLPTPLDTAALFGRAAPLEIEVGCGKGLFLSAAATARPETNYLGIEILAKYARFSAARVARARLDNAIMVHGDAQRLLGERLSAGAAQAVHVYFPDPWWKARHKKRRVMNESFLHDVERVLAPLGSLHFWTDVEEYFQTALELVAQHTRLRGPLDEVEKPAEHDLDYRTHFERRVRLANAPVYRARFEKA